MSGPSTSIRASSVLLLLAVVLAAKPAVAQQHASAEELFQLGKTAMAKKDYAHACDYFKASLQSEFALGTMLNLATCHEQQGKVASAWSEFHVLEDRALRASPPQIDRADFAHDKAEALRPRLSRVRLFLSPEAKRTKGLVAKVDGTVLDSHLYEVGAPVDPGERTLVVEAPDREPWSHTFTVAGEHTIVPIEVPALRVVFKPEQIDVAEADRRAALRSRKTAGIVVGGIGAASLVTGIVFGLLAKQADGQTSCPAPCYVTDQKLTDAHDAYTREKTYAWVSDVGVGLGILGLGVGTYLVLKAPRSTAKKQTGLRIGPAGLVFEGTL